MLEEDKKTGQLKSEKSNKEQKQVRRIYYTLEIKDQLSYWQKLYQTISKVHLVPIVAFTCLHNVETQNLNKMKNMFTTYMQ